LPDSRITRFLIFLGNWSGLAPRLRCKSSTASAQFASGEATLRHDALESEARSLRETGMPDGLHPDTPVVTMAFFSHSEFSSAEIEAIRRLVGHSIAAVERELICETLARRGGNRTHAANILGISIRALRNKIRVYRTRGRGVPEPNSLLRAIVGVGLPPSQT
jgi:transcriptional regulator with GAF, ATPase, and Fis domain